MEKFVSRKLILTLVVVIIVAGSDMLGLGLSDDTLTSLTTMVLSFVGAQGLVDVSEAIRSGRKVADAVEEVSFVNKHNDKMTALLLDVTEDIGSELVGLNQIQRDSRIALEAAHRLDKAINIPNELAEALDFFGFFLAALAVLGVVRAIEKDMARKKERKEKLERRLQERGPKMAAAAKRRIERRIAKLEEAVR